MIERYVLRGNTLSLKRWRRLKRQKRVVIAAWALAGITLLSFTAELWANSRPVVLRYRGDTYFPVLKSYHPTVFGIEGEMVTDYRKLSMGADDWAVWPPVKWDPYESNLAVEKYPSPPTGLNPLGTDDRGRDVLTRILYGYRYSIAYAVLVWILTTTFAILAGGLMGYAGGWVDLVGQRFVEVMSSVPYLFILIILASIFTPNLLLLVLLTSFFGWIFLSYYVRGEFLKNRRKEFVEAAHALGMSHSRVIFRHILPNSLVPVLTFSPFVISSYIVGLATLDYLGFGLIPPTPSWGELLHQAKDYFTIAWWLAVYPSAALFLTLLCLAVVGDGIRNAFDPKKS